MCTLIRCFLAGAVESLDLSGHNTRDNTMLITVPPGVFSGQTVSYITDTGQQMQVVVPAGNCPPPLNFQSHLLPWFCQSGLQPGQQMQVVIPPNLAPLKPTSQLPTVGSQWVLHGLKSAAHLNGLAVTVVSLKEEEGRVVVRTEDGQTAAVKCENLVRPEEPFAISMATTSAGQLPTVGSQWVLHGLKSAAHLNGLAVTVVSLKEEEGRVVVRTEDGQTAAVKCENLVKSEGQSAGNCSFLSTHIFQSRVLFWCWLSGLQPRQQFQEGGQAADGSTFDALARVLEANGDVARVVNLLQPQLQLHPNGPNSCACSIM